MPPITTAPDGAGWTDRIGSLAAQAIARRRRRLRAGWLLIALAPLVFASGVGIVVDAGSTRVGATDRVASATAAALGIALLVLGCIVLAQSARAHRLLAEGYALRRLRPGNPSLTAVEIGRHLRRTADFDTWADRIGLRQPDTEEPCSTQTNWEPGTRSTLASGAPALRLRRAADLLLIVAVMCSAGAGIAVLASDSPLRHVDVSSIVLIAGATTCAVAAAVLLVISVRRIHREYRAGYTTLVPPVVRGTVFDFRTGVDLVDVRTGCVVRAAGDLPLDVGTLTARLDRLRSASPPATRDTGCRDAMIGAGYAPVPSMSSNRQSAGGPARTSPSSGTAPSPARKARYASSCSGLSHRS